MMSSKLLLSLDLSTTCSGYAVYDLEKKTLIEHGWFKPDKKLKGVYPGLQLAKMQDLATQIVALILRLKPTKIAIEEIVSHKARLTGKTLDGFHYIVVDRIQPVFSLENIEYIDVSAWRKHFNIRLSDQDKFLNKEARKLNKRINRREPKFPVVDWKTLSSRYVNKKFNMQLDPAKHSEDGDVSDAILVGLFALEKV